MGGIQMGLTMHAACALCGATRELDQRNIDIYNVEMWTQQEKHPDMEDVKTLFHVVVSLCDECYVSEPVASRGLYEDEFSKCWGVSIALGNPK